MSGLNSVIEYTLNHSKGNLPTGFLINCMYLDDFIMQVSSYLKCGGHNVY